MGSYLSASTSPLKTQIQRIPTRAYTMYVPDLKGNSDELEVGIED
ncbi:MAG: hypothetical protein ACJ8FY_22340 [Gemmataceae bacterium]